MSVEVALSAAERGKVDLYFLAKIVLGRVYPDLTEKTHGPICSFFVQKDPARKFFLQDDIKNRLLLYPRGHFKTSINICDCIQWMLCFPNITIQLLSGTEELTYRMVGELKEHFLTNGDFRALYPHFVPPDGMADFGTKGEFTVPPRTMIRREPTISISTIKSVKAGSHYDLQKGDDTVNEINSATAELNSDVARRWSHTKPLLNPGGYRELIGTFYDYSCHYGPIVDKYREGTLRGWKVLIGQALTPDPKTGELFTEDGILFPERFCIDSNQNPEKENLQQIWRDDPELFNAQYQNEPLGKDAAQFPMDQLRAHVISRRQIPPDTSMVCSWYLAYDKKKKSDFSTCILGGFDTLGNLYVVDIFRGRFTPSEIIDNLIYCWRKWPVMRVGLEQKKATALLGPALHARQMEQRIAIPIDFQKESTEEEFQNQVLSLSPLLLQNKLWFVSECSHLQDLFLQFSRFPKFGLDDIPKAVARLLNYRAMGFRPELNPQQAQEFTIGGAMTYGDGECGAGIVA